MKAGDVVLAPLSQADGITKNRPAILLCDVPPFGDMLLCGISRQMGYFVPGFDETIKLTDDDFEESGLNSESLIRLGFITVASNRGVVGRIGSIAPERHKRLLMALAEYLIRQVDRTDSANE